MRAAGWHWINIVNRELDKYNNTWRLFCPPEGKEKLFTDLITLKGGGVGQLQPYCNMCPGRDDLIAHGSINPGPLLHSVICRLLFDVRLVDQQSLVDEQQSIFYCQFEWLLDTYSSRLSDHCYSKPSICRCRSMSFGAQSERELVHPVPPRRAAACNKLWWQ